MRALRYIKPATSFRSGYAYDNVLYAVAGQLIEEVSGQTWEVFVRERVLKPAGMTSSVTEQSARFANPNRAWPHARIGGRVRGMGEQAVLDERKTLGDNGAPAGGLSSSANDMAHWMQVQLGHGTWTDADGKQVKVFSEAQSQQMWTPRCLTPTPNWPGKLADARAEVLRLRAGLERARLSRREDHRARRRGLRRADLRRAVPGTQRRHRACR